MLVLYFLGSIIFVLADQLTKWAVLNHVRPVETIPLWEGVFHLTYCENRGAAFGILQNKFLFFYIVTALVVLSISVYIIYKRPKSKVLTSSLALLVGGAVGNFIDRLFRGFVVDFLDFRLIHFPIFNVADCFVVCGAILLACYIVFKKDESDGRVHEFKMKI